MYACVCFSALVPQIAMALLCLSCLTGIHALQDTQQKDRQEVKSLKEALREVQHRQPTLQSPDSQQASQTALEESQAVSAQTTAAGQQVSKSFLIGYVTSEAPRGLVGRGACGVCLGASLGALRVQQTPRKEAGGVLVAYRSPLSSVLRIAEAQIVSRIS